MQFSFGTIACVASLGLLVNCTAQGEAVMSSRNMVTPPTLTTPAARDIGCLAEAIYFEARGTGDVGQQAVAHVVVNRAQSGEFPDSVCGVVADGCQFSYRCDGHADVLAEPRARIDAIETAQAVLTGAPDITRGALFFHAATAAPGWFDSRSRVGAFGGNVFYR